jgi:hypothetical protein
MTEENFWDITPRAFFNAVEGFESLRRDDLEIQRLQTFRIVGSWAKVKDPKSLYSFSWERTVVSDKEKALAQRKAKYLSEKFSRIEKRHGG